MIKKTFLLLSLVALFGCNGSNAGAGAVGGALGGAVIGTAVGGSSGTAWGALGGATIGYLIGSSMDEQQYNALNSDPEGQRILHSEVLRNKDVIYLVNHSTMSEENIIYLIYHSRYVKFNLYMGDEPKKRRLIHDVGAAIYHSMVNRTYGVEK